MARNENIQVSLRLRPLNRKEIEERDHNVWKISQNTVSLKPKWARLLLEQKKISSIARTYSYDHCFTSKDTNQKLYAEMAEKLVLSSLEGYNGTLFVYGQTGSGKTYTMMGEGVRGDGANRGLLLQGLESLFTTISNSHGRHFFLTCSYLEIYNEQVFDLLAELIEPLSVSEDPQRGFYVKNLSEHMIRSLPEALSFVELGERSRRYAATSMNHKSSRSHTIFRLFVSSVADSDNLTTEGVLNFVDLAGSERASSLLDNRRKSQQSIESLLSEGKHINKSLFYLCQVINKLSDTNSANKNDNHIPYRNSNLTKILRSSLGGNSRTSIICVGTPALSQFEMTLSTLRFGGTAKTITNKVAANVRNNRNAEVLASYKRDIEKLKRELELAQDGGRAKDENAALMKKQLEDKVLRLTHMLFTQSKTETTNSTPELWAANVGDLIIDKNLVPSKAGHNFQLRYDEKGLMAIERMRHMHKDLKAKDQELSQLREIKSSLLDSKNNLKNDLKKALSLCKELSDKKQKYKDKYKAAKQSLDLCAQRMLILEKQSGIENFDSQSLSKLENFFACALENVRNVRIGRECQPPPQPWEDIAVESTHNQSHESSLDFETSFYRHKPKKDQSIDESFESHSSIANLLENEIGHNFSPIKKKSLDNVIVPEFLQAAPLQDMASKLNSMDPNKT